MNAELSWLELIYLPRNLVDMKSYQLPPQTQTEFVKPKIPKGATSSSGFVRIDTKEPDINH